MTRLDIDPADPASACGPGGESPPEPVVLANPALGVEIVPGLGGKIAQLTDRRSGRAWLWHHPRLPWCLPDPTLLLVPDVYVRMADLGGWDECCPTVGHSVYPLPPLAGRSVPDHGECWYTPPESVWENLAVEQTWRGRVLPFELQRRVALDPVRSRVTAAYTLRALAADAPLALLWSAHPLFNIQAGMRLELPEGTPMTVTSAGSPFGPPGSRFAWPLAANIDLSRVTPGAGWQVKLFSDLWDPGALILSAPGGEGLRIVWSSEAGQAAPLLRLGVWLNYGGGSGDGGEPLNNMGLEPCIGMPDGLHEAIANGTALRLQPGEERRWQVEVEVKVEMKGGEKS